MFLRLLNAAGREPASHLVLAGSQQSVDRPADALLPLVGTRHEIPAPWNRRMSIMMNPLSTCRAVLAIGLTVAGLAASASAQDLYKSRAEMLTASALDKQADATMVEAMAHYGKAQAEVAKMIQEIREKAAQNDMLETETYYKKRGVSCLSGQPTREIGLGRNLRQGRSQIGSGGTGFLSFRSRVGQSSLANAADRRRVRCPAAPHRRAARNPYAGGQRRRVGELHQVLAVLNTLKTALCENIRRYTSADYLAARNFLAGVALEAQRSIARKDVETLDRVAVDR